MLDHVDVSLRASTKPAASSANVQMINQNVTHVVNEVDGISEPVACMFLWRSWIPLGAFWNVFLVRVMAPGTIVTGDLAWCRQGSTMGQMG